MRKTTIAILLLLTVTAHAALYPAWTDGTNVWTVTTNGTTTNMLIAGGSSTNATVLTNDTRELSLSNTNNHIEVRNPDHGGDAVNLDTLINTVAALQDARWFGSTNPHPSFTGSYALLADEPPVGVVTQALAAGACVTNYWWCTNAYARIAKGTYSGITYARVTGAGTKTASVWMVTSVDGGATTQYVDQAQAQTITATTFARYRWDVDGQQIEGTNGSETVWMGIGFVVGRSGGGAAAGALEFGLGDPFDTRWEGPAPDTAVELGFRGGTSAVYTATSGQPTYNTATRVFSFPTNSFGGGGGTLQQVLDAGNTATNPVVIGGSVSLSNSVYGNKTELARTGEVSWLSIQVTNAVAGGTPCWIDPNTNSTAGRWDFVTTNSAGNAIDTHAADTSTNNLIPSPTFATGPQRTILGTNRYNMVVYAYYSTGTTALVSSTLKGLGSISGTVSFWVNPGVYSAGNRECWSINKNVSANYGLSFWLSGSGGVNYWNCDLLISGAAKWRLDGDKVFRASQWMHVAINHDGSCPVVYTNGVVAAYTFATSTDTSLWTQAVIADGCDNMCVAGAYRGSAYIACQSNTIAFPRIYTNALSASDIANLYLYQGGLGGPTNSQEWCIEDAPSSSTNYLNYTDTVWRHQPNGLSPATDFIGNGTNNLVFDSILETHNYSNTATWHSDGAKIWPDTDNLISLGNATHFFKNAYVKGSVYRYYADASNYVYEAYTATNRIVYCVTNGIVITNKTLLVP